MSEKKPLKAASTPVDYWELKTPCWEMTKCPEPIYTTCPAYQHRSYPCWEIEGTYCKWNDWGSNGRDTSLCPKCDVYPKWGHGGNIELKLQGAGMKLLID